MKLGVKYEYKYGYKLEIIQKKNIQPINPESRPKATQKMTTIVMDK